jgi:parvulin-like peptidyl-prolyl isomerase
MMLAFHSDDSSAQQGGDLGFGPNQMVKPLMILFLILVVGLVETAFGFHY